MSLSSLSSNNTSLFTNFHHLINPNFTRNEYNNSSTFVFRGGNRYRFRYSDRKTVTVKTTASLGGLLGGIFKGGADTGESTRQQYAATVASVNLLEKEMISLADDQLVERTQVLKQRARKSPQSLDSILPVSITPGDVNVRECLALCFENVFSLIIAFF